MPVRYNNPRKSAETRMQARMYSTTGIQPISKNAKTLARRNDMNFISTTAVLAGKFTVHGM